jgi:hypothetical protein
MRWLTGLVLVLGCLWGGYWFVGKRGFEAATHSWFDTLQAQGKTATNGGLEILGFPNRFDLTVTDLHIADPVTGLDWQAPFFQVLSLSYKPWHVIAAFPPEQRLALLHEAMTIRSGKLQASVVVKPQPSLPLDRLTLAGSEMDLIGDSGWTLQAEALQFASRADESRANWHEVGLNLTNLTPDARLMALFQAALPPQIGLIRADAHLGFTAPIDRLALQTQPRLETIELADLRLEWGTMLVSASGTAKADAAGFTEGDALLRLENWRVALDVAQSMGVLTAENRRLWEQAAQFLSARSNGKETIELPVQFKNGLAFVGPIPVGPAPRFYLQ